MSAPVNCCDIVLGVPCYKCVLNVLVVLTPTTWFHLNFHCAAAAAKLLQLCPTLCDPTMAAH